MQDLGNAVDEFVGEDEIAKGRRGGAREQKKDELPLIDKLHKSWGGKVRGCVRFQG